MARLVLVVSSALVVFASLMATSSVAAMPGSAAPADPNSADVSQAAEVAVALLNNGDAKQLEGTHVSGPLVLTKIKSVTSQVVAGLLYTITISVKGADNVEKDLVVKVWSRPWLAARNDPKDPAWQLTDVKAATNTD